MEDLQEKQPPDVLTSDTNNSTRIEPLDAPSHKREKFEAFRAYNTGLWNGPRRENKELMHQQDDLHLYDAIASELELTAYQKARGRDLLDSFSVTDYTTPNGDRTTQAVLFALCAVVANADVDGGTRYWPHPQAKSNDPLFERLADQIPTEWPELVSLVMKLDHRLEV